MHDIQCCKLWLKLKFYVSIDSLCFGLCETYFENNSYFSKKPLQVALVHANNNQVKEQKKIFSKNAHRNKKKNNNPN